MQNREADHQFCVHQQEADHQFKFDARISTVKTSAVVSAGVGSIPSESPKRVGVKPKRVGVKDSWSQRAPPTLFAAPRASVGGATFLAPRASAPPASANPDESGKKGSNVYEVNQWLWEFARGKPRLGGLSVTETEERCQRSLRLYHRAGSCRLGPTPVRGQELP